MSVAEGTIRTQGGSRSRPTGRFLIASFLVIAFVVGIFGARLATSQRGLSDLLYMFHGTAAATTRMPTSTAIENAWGIRMTNVNIIADGGMVELRYEVVDAAKGGRIHRDVTLKNMPVLIAEATGQKVNSHDLMFHIHRGMGVHDEGRSYSIVYGNANFAIRPGSLVTITMSDGLVLRHVPVSV